jgi:hypothetical protein
LCLCACVFILLLPAVAAFYRCSDLAYFLLLDGVLRLVVAAPLPFTPFRSASLSPTAPTPVLGGAIRAFLVYSPWNVDYEPPLERSHAILMRLRCLCRSVTVLDFALPFTSFPYLHVVHVPLFTVCGAFLIFVLLRSAVCSAVCVIL